MHGHEGFLSVLLSAFFGALASVGQLLSSAKILTPRRIFASMLGGITGGVFSGALFGVMYPDLAQNTMLVSGAGSLGGVFGVHAMMMYFFAKHAPEILGKKDQPDSLTLKQLMNTGEHSTDEIEAMIKQKRAEREARKARSKGRIE